MAKSTKRKLAAANKKGRKLARYMHGMGQSKYAKKHKGGGNTGPNGMWVKVEGRREPDPGRTLAAAE